MAQEFYAALLLDTGRPRPGPGATSCASAASTAPPPRRFGVGFAPAGGEALSRHLRERGLHRGRGGHRRAGRARGSRGLYDRFRGRLVWPIRDITGDIVGFGARRLFDDDRIDAKYLNTSETPIYKKSQVLYGLDAAKKAISHRAAGGRRRGLHRRHGLPPRRRRDRGRHVRHGVRRRARQGAAAASCATRPSWPRPGSSSPSTATPPARRPRCGRSARTSAGPRSRSSPSSPTAWTRASCGRARATRRCARSSRTPCRCSSSRCARRSGASTSTRPRAGSRR